MTITRIRPAVAVGLQKVWPVAIAAFAIALLAQLAGQVTFDVGPGSVVFFPMVWGLVAGAIVSVQRFRRVSLEFQLTANAFVAVALLFLVVRLAFTIGPNIQVLLHAGPSLFLQEVGHLLGTVVLALPLAVLLRMGPAAIGATFSLDREPALPMVNEKYGPDSDQYRGVLAMYVFGTLVGAVYVTMLSSFIVSFDIFDPLALAMGSGVGSGSMMAAATGSITDAYPGQKDQILAMAGVSNLITTILGVYVGIYLALPAADRFYRFLTRRETQDPEAAAVHQEANRAFREQVAATSAPVGLRIWVSVPILAVVGITTASVFAKGLSWDIIGGYAIMAALLVLGTYLAKVTRFVSAIIWVTTIGALASSTYSPIGDRLTSTVGSIDFLSVGCVVLTFAGLSLGKDTALLKAVSWKIVPVGLLAITASFLLATVIAEVSLGFWS
ncbi:DUF3100 domain-containing protein [Actinacidiphila bryophytorum]|uniref:DUF3100 domain-containing protein n=2 Tax=Actinacidiphila bryophytorum TaxID=1436133 RepID=A0A9W4E3D4_9ACTN|nr:DUF3100 domain-containing protein [Actinacidiphila bryophytorum]MBM9438476.1 DUF3100 domain-containing protein [Actinacidiphila bryophytorum]CAG7613211.1 conserved membrane hypothetical protein [Actinacidiphila bryophytorum]